MNFVDGRDPPLDLQVAVDAIDERCNACRLVSAAAINDELPVRKLSRAEVDLVLNTWPIAASA